MLSLLPMHFTERIASSLKSNPGGIFILVGQAVLNNLSLERTTDKATPFFPVEKNYYKIPAFHSTTKDITAMHVSSSISLLLFLFFFSFMCRISLALCHWIAFAMSLWHSQADLLLQGWSTRSSLHSRIGRHCSGRHKVNIDSLALCVCVLKA